VETLYSLINNNNNNNNNNNKFPNRQNILPIPKEDEVYFVTYGEVVTV
jgi:hypothetical protein